MKLFRNNEHLNGATGHDDPRDWEASSIDSIDLKKIPRLQKPTSFVNQGKNKQTKSACTIAGAYMQICQIFNRISTQYELLEVVERMHDNLGYNYTGQYSATGMNMVRKRRNNFNPDKKVFFVKYAFDDVDLQKLLFDKKALVGATYRGNKKYGKDFRPDGILDGTEFKPSTYGHRTNLYELGVFDSYYGGSRNEYKLGRDKNTLSELVDNGVYYPTMYFFVKESRVSNSIDTIKEQQKMIRLATIFVNSNSLFRKYLTTVEQKQISKIVSKYRKKYQLDNITVEKGKIMSITTSVIKEFFTYIDEDKRRNVLNAILTL